jgi:hypothetical protein
MTLSMRYYARLNPAKLDEAFLNRAEVMRLSDVGAQLGFGLSVLHERGLLRDASALNAESAVPLLTWPCLDFLESLDLAEHTLLELGAGNSTLWFQRRFRGVRSFETDPTWQGALSQMVEPNVELRLVTLESLEAADIEYRDETFVLVDFAGRRTRFLRHFLTRLAGRRPSAIVLDNADWYRNGATLLTGAGYREIPFYGFKSGQAFVSCTSLFIDPAHFKPALKDPFFYPAFSRRFENPWDQA